MPDLSRLKPHDLDSLQRDLMTIVDMQTMAISTADPTFRAYYANMAVKKTKQLLANVDGEINEVRATFGLPLIDVAVQPQVAN